jgi:hypothetical protein
VHCGQQLLFFSWLHFQMHREAFFFGSINYSMAHDFSRLELTFPTFHHLEVIRI